MLLTISRPWSHGLLALSLLACGARSALEEDGGGAGAGGTGATGAGAAGGVGGVGGTSPTVGGFGGEGGEGGVIDPVCPTPDATFCTEPEPCYLGPAEVAGKGTCAVGERNCAAGGVGRSECYGAVLPRPDNCVAPTAWTCDDTPHPCHPTLEVSAPGDVVRHASIVDQDTYYTTDGFELRLYDGGAVAWSYAIGGNGNYDVAIPPLAHDATGVIVAGRLGASGFVTKVSPAGAEIWKRVFTTAMSDESRIATVSVAVDGGYLMGGRALGDEVLDGFNFPQGGYLAKLSAEGVVQWVQSIEGEDQSVAVLQARADGSVVVAGSGIAPCSPAGSGSHPAISAFEATGKPLWSWHARDAGNHGPYAEYNIAGEVRQLEVDAQGRIFAVGRLDEDASTAVDLGDGIPRVGRVYILALDADGGHRWSHNFLDGDTQWSAGGRIALSATGNVVWATQIPNRSVLRTFDPDGTLLWERPIHSNPTQPPMKLWSLEALPDGSVLVGGDIEGPAEFPTVTLQGGHFLASFGP